MPSPQVHNGNCIAPRKRALILALLGRGESNSYIARTVKVARDTVIGIRDLHIDELRQRKESLAAQFEQIAFKATERLHAKLDSNIDIAPAALVPIAGVAVDKAIALRADPSLPINVLHSHQHIHAHISERSYQELLDSLPDVPSAPPTIHDSK